MLNFAGKSCDNLSHDKYLYKCVTRLTLNQKALMKQIAIIGPTASGKTSLSISIAKSINAYILSLDSLSIYQQIDIASAKPTVAQREGIGHFGIDVLYPDEPFAVTTYIELYKKAYQESINDGKNLVIVGGSSFYLKALIAGISPLPKISDDTIIRRNSMLRDREDTYKLLQDIDEQYMRQIPIGDSYRMEKALDIYLQTQMPPSQYFRENPPVNILDPHTPIYEIETHRAELRERISKRTKSMIEEGLIDEVCMLEKRYSRSPNSMKAIGIKETLAYLDGIYNMRELEEKISTNTARLAKRQVTFNKSQFEHTIKGSVVGLEKEFAV